MHPKKNNKSLREISFVRCREGQIKANLGSKKVQWFHEVYGSASETEPAFKIKK